MTCWDILPAEQRALLPHLRGIRDVGYTLYGGTAVALQLGHRHSIDFDFFTDREFDEAAIRATSPLLATAQITQQAPRTLTLLTEPLAGGARVKISFFAGLRFGRVGQPVMTDGGELRLSSLVDLLGHKLKVVLHRSQAKDYHDIAAILRHGVTLEQGMGAARSLIEAFPIAEAARALAYYGDGDLSRVGQADRVLLSRAARDLDDAPPLPVISRSLS